MKFGKMILGALWVTASSDASSRYSIPPSESKELVSIANEARRDVTVHASRMHKVSWNHSMQTDLYDMVKSTSPSWWFDKNQNTSRYNLEALMEFEPFKSKYPTWGFLIHDSCQKGPTAVRRIFIYRAINQKPYFSYNNCNATGFVQGPGSINSYLSCERKNYPDVSHQDYSWVWQYMPELLLENTTQIACEMLGIPGPDAAGNGAPDHFMCFRNNATPQVNEQPYKAGPSCSECPPSTKCSKKLCV